MMTGGAEYRRPYMSDPELSRARRALGATMGSSDILAERVRAEYQVTVAIAAESEEIAKRLHEAWEEWLETDVHLPSDEMLNAMSELWELHGIKP